MRVLWFASHLSKENETTPFAVDGKARLDAVGQLLDHIARYIHDEEQGSDDE